MTRKNNNRNIKNKAQRRTTNSTTNDDEDKYLRRKNGSCCALDTSVGFFQLKIIFISNYTITAFFILIISISLFYCNQSYLDKYGFPIRILHQGEEEALAYAAQQNEDYSENHFLEGIHSETRSFSYNNVEQELKQQQKLLSTNRTHEKYQQSTCKLYLAKSTIPNSGLGMFTAEDIETGSNIGTPDIVIQIPDIYKPHAQGWSLFLQNYGWLGQETGGQYEGIEVASAVPGVGMLANGHPTQFNALQPSGSTIDTMGMSRMFNPGAGASSYYGNFSFVASRTIRKGEEIFVNYGKSWFDERIERGTFDMKKHGQESNKLSTEWLHENGVCLDNIHVGISNIPEAGKGAFATRFIPKGTVVAPLPVIQITDRRSMDIFKVKDSSNHGDPDSFDHSTQLFLNYCFGHNESSVLLFPYSPIVNYINHDPNNTNVALRWSRSSQHEIQNPHSMGLNDLKSMKHGGLMLEYVATTDIHHGEEILSNYGSEWEAAWFHHLNSWKPIDDVTLNANIDDDDSIRTVDEQTRQPYPSHMFTSCYYKYKNTEYTNLKASPFRWNGNSNMIMDRNLRPCSVLERYITKNGDKEYKVEIKNRFGLLSDERIPYGLVHVVEGVPHYAIKLSSKIYTTDQHLPNVFRHAIGIPDDIFPYSWRDLL